MNGIALQDSVNFEKRPDLAFGLFLVEIEIYCLEALLYSTKEYSVWSNHTVYGERSTEVYPKVFLRQHWQRLFDILRHQHEVPYVKQMPLGIAGSALTIDTP